ncbi:MAG TPA: NAD(P)-dependent oxidoreductase [Thermomicrobiales bacterium]|nr:NAD(P)-dependent oxidoreductase [Thermomicrobiales bacterium]
MSLALVTGATGEVGRGVLPWLQERFALRLLALDPPGDDPRRVQADLLDWQALASVMIGVDAVLHLAVATGHNGVYEDDAFNDCRFDVNVKGAYHVFETARRAGVRRVVHVSSLMVVWGHGGAAPIAGDAPPLPVGVYALTKALSEQIAHHYAVSHGMEVVTLRIAAPLDINDPEWRRKAVRPQQVPLPDLAQAFALALTVPLHGYETVTIVGESSRRIWDLEPARRVLGYEPRYRLDDLGVQWAEPFAVEP